MSAPDARVRGLDRLALASGIGLAGGLIGLVLPIAFLELAQDHLAGFFQQNGLFFEVLGALVLAGAALLAVSFFLYRRAFWALREESRALTLAVILCTVGSLGFLLLLLTSVIVLGSSDALAQCVAGQPSHALTCLKASSSLGGVTAVLGFWLGWVGGVGLVLGLVGTGRRFRRWELYEGGSIYALLLVVLVGPFLGVLISLPDIADVLWFVPVLVLLAPAFSFAGAQRSRRALRPPGPWR